MKFLKQFSIILFISFLGEILHHLIPAPIPTSIYGIVLLFLALAFKIIPVSAVKEVSSFLIEIMPIMFIPAAAGLLNAWEVLKPAWLQYAIVMILTTFLVMFAAGKVTQTLLVRKEAKEETRHGAVSQ